MLMNSVDYISYNNGTPFQEFHYFIIKEHYVFIILKTAFAL